MALQLDLERVKANIQKAETEDLLDRATIHRDGMEPAALELIAAELQARGVGAAEVTAHWARRPRTVAGRDGFAGKCEKCVRPAAVRRWGWHRLWGLLPLFPRPLAYCEEHLPPGWRPAPLLPSWDDPPPASSKHDEGIQKKSEDIRPTSSD